MKRLLLLALLIPLTWTGPARAERAASEDVAWLHFDDAKAALPTTENCAVSVGEDAYRGTGCLVITPPQPMKKVARVTFTLPDGIDLLKMGALKMHLRATPTEESLSLRWLAEDAEGHMLLQRRFSHDQGAVWSAHEFPLALWRWGNSQCGDWSEVRQLTLVVENRVEEVRVDELEFEPGAARATPELIDEIAFAKSHVLTSERGGYRISSNAVEKLSAADIEKVHARFDPIPRWIERVFGDAVKPLNDEPVQVLIFNDREQYAGFGKRLGTAWRVTISPPSAGGYAIQDIATSFVNPQAGVDRPVFFHETVHATAARMLRLMPGAAPHSWLQEGLANYLQLCLFPQSLGLDTYPRLFKEGVGDKTYFQPLDKLLTERVELRHYAQLASLTAWLIEKHNDWLKTITKEITGGGKLEDALKTCETDFAGMQTEWLAWGRAKFPADGKPKQHFDKPAEWQPDGK